jgi:hypothetical protein
MRLSGGVRLPSAMNACATPLTVSPAVGWRSSVIPTPTGHHVG